jgi:hypothetical protein
MTIQVNELFILMFPASLPSPQVCRSLSVRPRADCDTKPQSYQGNLGPVSKDISPLNGNLMALIRLHRLQQLTLLSSCVYSACTSSVGIRTDSSVISSGATPTFFLIKLLLIRCPYFLSLLRRISYVPDASPRFSDHAVLSDG